MEGISKHFQWVVERLSDFKEDVQRIKYNLESPPEKKKDMKSLQPVTKLRENTGEAKKMASLDKDTRFVIDALNNIFEE